MRFRGNGCGPCAEASASPLLKLIHSGGGPPGPGGTVGLNNRRRGVEGVSVPRYN